MRAPGSRRTSTIMLAVAAVLALTACVPEGPSASPGPSESTVTTPSPGASPSASPTESAEPSTTPAPSPSATSAPDDLVALPACVDLIPLSTVRTVFGADAEPIETTASAADVMPGPVAAETARRAVQSEVCVWGIPFSDGGFSVVTAELTDSARTALVTALRASSYTETTIDGEVAFTREIESDFGTTAVAYLLSDPVWITVNGTLTVGGARDLAAAALDGVRAANP